MPLTPAFHKGLKLTLKSIAGIFVILFIFLLLLIWRLSSSPIQLNQFVPRIEQAASALPGGLSVKLKGLGLYWNHAERQVNLKALNVELVESSGSSLLSVPEVSISLSVSALMRGVVAASSIEIQDLDVQMLRREDGSFQLHNRQNGSPVAVSDSKTGDAQENTQHIFKVLAAEADPQNPLSYLKKIKLTGSLEIEDKKSGLHWTADLVESLLVRHNGEVKGDLDIEFGETATPLKLHLGGTVEMVEDTASLKLFAELKRLKVNEFDLYWPGWIAQGARKWLVANLKAGAVNNAELDLAMIVLSGGKTNLQLKELKGTLDYSDLTITYLGSLPPATGVAGSGTFDQHGFDLGISKGQVNGVSIKSGQVLISGLDDQKAAISVKTHLNGQLAKVFAVLEAPPIGLSAESFTGLVSDQLGGQIEFDFNISLPLQSELADRDIKYQARGKITEGGLRKIYRNYDLQMANLDFNLDESKLNFKGPLELSGIPLIMDWTSILAGAGKGHADFTLNSPNITGPQISGLGYDVSKYLQGTIALKTKAKVMPGGAVTASINSSLNNAALTIPQIHLDKRTGDGGSIDFNLQIDKKHLHAKDINISLGRIQTRNKAEFYMAGSQMSLTLDHLSLPDIQLEGLKLELTEEKNLQFTFRGGEVNLVPFLSGNSQDIAPLEKQVAVKSKALAEKMEASGIVFEVGQSRLDKVYIYKENYFDDVEFSGRWDTRGWQEVKLSGHNPLGSRAETGSQPGPAGRLKSGQFIVVYGPPENGQYPLRIEVEDLGSLVSAVKDKNMMNGGYLVLNGDSQGPLLTQPIQATFEVKSFTVKDAPTISSVLNIASLTQIISSLQQTGLAFNSASGDLQLNGTRLSSRQIRMKGGSLGLFGKGWVDMKQRNMELSGTLVPLGKLNYIVGKIPLLGQVVVDKDGGGIMAFDYSVKGTVGDPEISTSKTPLTPAILESTGVK